MSDREAVRVGLACVAVWTAMMAWFALAARWDLLIAYGVVALGWLLMATIAA